MNPTTYVSDVSFAEWMKIGAARTYNGLWLEAATENYIKNPIGAVDRVNWIDGHANTDISRESVLPGPLPGWLSSKVTTGFKVTTVGNVSAGFALTAGDVTLPAAGLYDNRQFVWVPSAFSGTGLVVRANNFAGGTNTDGVVNLAKRDQWQEVIGSIDAAGGDLAGHSALHLTSGSLTSGQELWFTCVAMQPTASGSIVVGSFGSGYGFVGTPHQSASTRAASSASISPSGIFDTYLGAIVFVATPTIETGAEEIWGELGEKLAGADHIRWGRDSTKHPFVEWSGNDSAYTRVTLTATVDAGDEHFYSIEWHVGDADFRLYLDDDPSENDTIPSPQEDYGAGPLKLQATAGGVIYGGLAICSERLTNDQRARLKVVMENRGNIETALDSKRGRYGFFQVRPKVE